MAIDLVARLSLDDQLSKRMGKVTKGVMAGAAAIGVGLGVAVKKFVEFDDQMRKAGAIAGASAAEFNAMKEAAIDMGAKTSKNATEVAESMAELAAKGFDANQTIAAMPGIIAASEASGESLAIAADTVSSALNIWSLEAAEAGHVADVLAMAANVSAAGIGDLQQAFKYAGAPAASLGVSLEELAGAIGIITDSGIDGSSAGTAMRASMLALYGDSKKVTKGLKALGVSTKDSNKNAKSLSQVVGELNGATAKMTNSQRVATIQTLVGTEAVSGFLKLMDAGPSKIDEMTNALENSDGAAAKTAAEMMAGIGGALEALGGAIDSFALRIGDKLAPYITLLANKLSEVDIMPFIVGFNKAVDVAESFAKSIAGSWGAIRGVVIPIIEALVTFGVVIASIAVGISVFSAIGTAIAFLVSPIGLVALGITALVLGFKAAYKHSEPFRKVVDKISASVKALGAGDGKGVMEALGFSPEMIAKVTEFVTGIKTKVGEFVTHLKAKWTELQPSIAMLLERFASMKDTSISIFTTLWGMLTPIFNALMNAFHIIADVAVMVWTNIIAPAIDFVISVFQALWKVVGPILELLGAAIGLAFEVLKIVWDTIIKPVAEYLMGTFATAFEAAKPYVEQLSAGFEVLGGIISTIAGWFTGFTDALSKFKIPNWLSKLGGGGTVKFEETTTEAKGKSNYHGIDYVPKNNYSADLHRGEAVLTAQENKQRQQGGSGGGVSITGNTFHVRQESDIDAIAEQLYVKWSAAAEGGA